MPHLSYTPASEPDSKLDVWKLLDALQGFPVWCPLKKASWHVPVFRTQQAAGEVTFQGPKEGERRCTWVWRVGSLNAAILRPSFGHRWLPESSRWLLLHGKSQLAVENLRKVAVMNGRMEEGERLTKEVGSKGARKSRNHF